MRKIMVIMAAMMLAANLAYAANEDAVPTGEVKVVGSEGDLEFKYDAKSSILKITIPISGDQTKKEPFSGKIFQSYAVYRNGAWEVVGLSDYIDHLVVKSGVQKGNKKVTAEIPITAEMKQGESPWIWFVIWGGDSKGPGGWLWILEKSKFYTLNAQGKPNYGFAFNTKTGSVKVAPTGSRP